MLAKNVATKRLNLALEPHVETGALQAKIESTYARKERGDGVRQDQPPRTKCERLAVVSARCHVNAKR